VTVLLMALSVTVGSANVISVLDVPPIDPDCKPPDVCATLYFYDAADKPLGALQGTTKSLKGMKNVAKVKQIGSGSYTVFKGKNHRALSACLRGSNMIDLKTEAYYQATVVKSVRYEHGSCRSMAGAPLWIIAAAIGVVVLIAVIVVAVMLRRKRSEGEPVRTEA